MKKDSHRSTLTSAPSMGKVSLTGSSTPSRFLSLQVRVTQPMPFVLLNPLQLGANEVRTSQGSVGALFPRSREINDPDVERFIANVSRHGVHNLDTDLFSAHQMGTCRMGASPDDGVVSPHGEVWECTNLFVADASVFPTSSGVNPMITNYAISYMTAKYIASDRLYPSRLRPCIYTRTGMCFMKLGATTMTFTGILSSNCGVVPVAIGAPVSGSCFLCSPNGRTTNALV